MPPRGAATVEPTIANPISRLKVNTALIAPLVGGPALKVAHSPTQTAVTSQMRVLILEEEPADAEQIKHELRTAGFKFTAKRVATRDAFTEALEALAPDVVLVDCHLSDYSSAEALAHVRHVHPEVPVIIVTGTIGDEAAMELLKAGAKDYVPKSNLLRLPSAVERVILVEDGIRARKTSEQALRAANALLQTTERIAHIGGFNVDAVHNTVVWSEETYRIHGQSPETYTPSEDKFLACVHPGDRERVVAAIAATTEHDAPFDIEFRIVRPDGEERVIHSRGELTRDEAGKPLHLIGTSQDITERKRAEEELRSSEERFRLLVEQAPEAILIYDHDQDRFIEANHKAELLFGCGRAELIKYGPQHFYPPKQPDGRPPAKTFSAHNEEAGRGKTIVFERRIRRTSGDERLCEVTLVPLPSATRRLLRSSFIDITQRKAAERTLHRLNRTLRALSAGNEVLVRAISEPELLTNMCRVAVETGGYRIAWIGVPQEDAPKSVTAAAWAGEQVEFLIQQLQCGWADESLRLGITGKAICSGEPQITENLAIDPKMSPWAAIAQEYGLSSGVAFPLKGDSGVFAVFTIYASELGAFDVDELKLLQELANDLAFGIRALREHAAREELEGRWRTSLEATISAIASTVEIRDPYTTGYQQRVAKLAMAIARRLSISDHDIHGIYLAGIIHDVGKITIPAEILSKPGKLSKLEYQLIQTHSQAGYDIVKGVAFPWPIAQMVLQHHERLDGSGYPQGLKGDAMLAGAKILAVADVVEAMMSHRPYRPTLGTAAALAEIEKGKGTLFDVEAVNACVSLFDHDGFHFD